MTDLSFHIRQFVPDCPDGEEMALRSSLLTARDYAARLRGTTKSETALCHAAEAHEVAGALVFSTASIDRLKIGVAYARHMVQAAFLIEHLERDEALL